MQPDGLAGKGGQRYRKGPRHAASPYYANKVIIMGWGITGWSDHPRSIRGGGRPDQPAPFPHHRIQARLSLWVASPAFSTKRASGFSL